MADRDEALAALLVDLARTLGSDSPIRRILDQLVSRVPELLPFSGAGVTIEGDSEETPFVAASSEAVREIEGLQRELGEGPCLEAWTTGETVQVPDLAADPRFPRFAPHARANGFAAVFAFPLRLDEVCLGAVDLYRDVPGELGAEDLAAGETLANVAAAYVFNARMRAESSVLAAQLGNRDLRDPLTGLANRLLLRERLKQAVARTQRSQLSVAVLSVGLDGFRAVNDEYGHAVGDALLRGVADRVATLLRPGDTLARPGGDEFVVVCEDLADPGQAEQVARRVTGSFDEAFSVDGRLITVAASAGVVFARPGPVVPESLLRDADAAMYAAKEDGGGRYHLSEPGPGSDGDGRADLDRDLRRALVGGQFHLRYQPIVDVRDGGPVAVEALLRWSRPGRGWVSPATVIPAAEQSGLITALGEWVIRQACADLRHWQTAIDPGGDGAVRVARVQQVAVNVSAQQVVSPGFVDTVHRILADTGVDPAGLTLEVTESVFLTEARRARAVLRGVRALGVGLALDDFGTGYSSLSYLRSLPFDTVKIDRSFVPDLPTEAAARTLMAAIVDLSHALGLTVVAEGIETRAELDQVTALGVDRVQGYLLAQPLPIDGLDALLRGCPDLLRGTES